MSSAIDLRRASGEASVCAFFFILFGPPEFLHEFVPAKCQRGSLSADVYKMRAP